MNGRRCVPLALGCMAALGCGPTVQSARFIERGPAPDAAEVQLYSTRVPECPYEEIGLVSGKRRFFWTPMEDVLQALRNRARRMGGDAIVGLSTSQVVTGGTSVGGVVSLDSTDRLGGTVVRFTDRDCRR